MIIVSDIDGTVLDDGVPMRGVISYIKKRATSVIFLTNRPDNERKKTVADLKKVGIEYTTLIMNTTGEPAPIFKKRVIQGLIDDEIAVAEFIDDRMDTRNAVRSIGGIKVTDPAKISGKKESLASYSPAESIMLAMEVGYDTMADVVDYIAAAKDIKIEVPQFIRDNAKRGLELNREGHGGDGLTDKTKQEARDMANGKVSIGKCVRMSAWFARHKVDVQADGFKNKKSPDYPSAGLVAWLLWGGDANGSMRAKEWADKQVERHSK